MDIDVTEEVVVEAEATTELPTPKEATQKEAAPKEKAASAAFIPGKWIIGGGIAAVSFAAVVAAIGAVLVWQNQISGTSALVAGLLGIPGMVLVIFGAVLLATEVTAVATAPQPSVSHDKGHEVSDIAHSLAETTRSGTPSRTLLTFGAGLLLTAVLLVLLVDGVVSIGGVSG